LSSKEKGNKKKGGFNRPTIRSGTGDKAWVRGKKRKKHHKEGNHSGKSGNEKKGKKQADHAPRSSQAAPKKGKKIPGNAPKSTKHQGPNSLGNFASGQNAAAKKKKSGDRRISPAKKPLRGKTLNENW